jgi:hypothetical protein
MTMGELGDLIRQIADELGATDELRELAVYVTPTEEPQEEITAGTVPTLTDEQWRRLKDLVTKEWDQIERLKQDSEALHKLATNEGLQRLKQMYDEHEDRFRQILIERWDRIAWLLAVPLDALQEIIVLMIPVLRILLPEVVTQVRIQIDQRPEQRDSMDPDVIQDLLQWIWTTVEWLVRVARMITSDFASRVVATYPGWRDGVLDQVMTDVIEHWGSE